MVELDDAKALILLETLQQNVNDAKCQSKDMRSSRITEENQKKTYENALNINLCYSCGEANIKCVKAGHGLFGSMFQSFRTSEHRDGCVNQES